MEYNNIIEFKDAKLMVPRESERIELVDKTDLIEAYKLGATHIVGRKIFYDYDFPDTILVETTKGEFEPYTDDVFMLVYSRHDVVFINKSTVFSLFELTRDTKIMMGL